MEAYCDSPVASYGAVLPELGRIMSRYHHCVGQSDIFTPVICSVQDAMLGLSSLLRGIRLSCAVRTFLLTLEISYTAGLSPATAT